MPAVLDDRQIHRRLQLLKGRLYSFEPRPDRPELFDQQTAFLKSKAKVSILEGGNGSGKTEIGAQKAARFMLWQQPPRKRDSTFMVLSDTLSQVCNICWKEKLSEIIPGECIDNDRGIRWHDSKQGFPLAVPLREWPNRPGKNWTIEFRSLVEGRRAFQGRTYDGFWFSEQFEWPVFEEVLRGCRETWYDGAHFAEFTPIDPDLCMEVEEKQERKLNGDLQDWEFYRLNSELNKSARIAEGAIESFLSGVSDALYETRRTGAHPSFAGAIYPEFNPAVHVLDDDKWEEICGARLPNFPPNAFHRRGIDFGESVAHPFVCLWAFKVGGDNWFVYDEYVEDTGKVLYRPRIEQIKDRWPWPDNHPCYGPAYADPSRPLIIMECCEYGVPTVGARASGEYHAGIETIRKLLDVNNILGLPKLFIHKTRCPRLVSELRRYRWIKSPAQVVAERGGRMPANPSAPKYEPLKWKDDTCDALRYMIHSDSMSVSQITSQPMARSDPRRHGVLGVNGQRSWRR